MAERKRPSDNGTDAMMKPTIETAWQEVSHYLDEALKLEGAALETWLNDLRAREPAIAIQVSSYLVELAELEQENFLATTLPVAPAGATLTGQRFGSYTLDQPIGHGGMGTVWLAHRSDGRFQGRAAVKLLNTALVGHPSEQRFVREGSVLARLHHPHIAHLLDAGVAAGSQPYLVLEYVEGEPLDHYCQTRALGIEQRIALFLDVLSAVAHAHSNLIVHRDLKPSNIMVTATGVVKLLDFGVAALLSPDGTDSTRLTSHGVPGLTPGYAAPEQLLGEPVTTATDVYSLGLILYVLLAGRHPILPEGRPAAELIRLALDAETPLPSQIVTDKKQARRLSGDLDNIVAMALRRNPVERYTTVDLFAQDLRHHLAREPVTARPRSLHYLFSRFVSRHRTGVTAAIVVLLTLIGAIAATTTQMIQAREQRDQARYDSRRAEASNDFLKLLMLSDGGPAKPALTVFERLNLGVQMLDQQYKDDPAFAGRMLVEMGGHFIDNQQTQRATELLERAYAIGRQHGDLELMASAQCNRIYSDAAADIREGVAQRIAEAQQLLAQLLNPHPSVQVECLRAQTRVALRSGDYISGEGLLKRALRILEAANSTHRPEYASVLSDLSDVYLSRNQPGDALRIEQSIADLHDRNGRGGTTSRLVARQNIATMLNAMGETAAALAEREIINQRVRELQSSGEEVLAYPINYSTVLIRMARPADALQALDGVIERVRRSGHRFMLAQTLLSAGSAYTQLQRWNEAEAALREADAIAAEGMGNKSTRAQIESFLARLDLERGALPAAHQHGAAAVQLAGYRTDKPERTLPRVLLVASRISLAEGNSSEAERFANDALAIFEPIARGPDTSADVGEALLRVVQARMASGANAVDVKSIVERAARCLSNGLGANHPLTLEARHLLASVA